MTMPRGVLVKISGTNLVAQQASRLRRTGLLKYTSHYHLQPAVLRRQLTVSPLMAISFGSRCHSFFVLRVLWSSRRRNFCGQSVMAIRRGGGGGDASVFDKWLTANPLPGTSPATENQIGGTNECLESRHIKTHVTETLGHCKLERLGEDRDLEVGLASDSPSVNGRNMDIGFNGLCSVAFNDMDLWSNSTGRRSVLGGNESILSSVSSEQNKFRRERDKGFDFEDLQQLGHREFSWRDTADVFYECLCVCGQMVWDNKHKCFLQVNCSEGAQPLAYVPPIIQRPLHASCTPSEYLKALQQSDEGGGKPKLLLALISSSAASLGIFHDDALVAHKVITAYTVRAKQGKAQLHYLRQGGPGHMTVGGSIRARETKRLFSRICEKLEEWQKDIEGCKFLFYSGNMRVWNEATHPCKETPKHPEPFPLFMFQTLVPPVYGCNDPTITVARDDVRWRKVPYSVRQPRLRELQRVYYGLSHGAVRYGVQDPSTCKNIRMS